MVHLVYCDNTGKTGEKELDKILNGTKSMIIRGATGRKIPHSRVFEGETLYFMEKGTFLITAKAIVKDVQNYVKLTDDEIENVLSENQSGLLLTEKQKKRWHKKCLCITEFENVEKIEPLAFEHQGNMDDWIIVEKIEDVLKGTSIKFTYENSKFK